jgi:two-component system OmpR family response regulator
MTVMLVEDEAKMAALLRRALGGVGLDVDIAERGEAAVEMAGRVAYEAVVLDVALPGIDGIEVCRRLRHDEFAGPILLMSVSGTVDSREAGIEAGADLYLVKPFHLSEFVNGLRDLMRKPPTIRA